MNAVVAIGGVAAFTALTALACVVPLHAASNDLAKARRDAERVVADVHRWSQGQARLTEVASGPAAGGDVVTQVQQALTASGVPVAAFRGVQPLTERVDAAAGTVERTVNVHFADVRPADAGAWLAAWQGPKQPWRVIGLSWSHPPAAAESTLDNNRYQLTFTLLLRTVASP